MFQKIKIIIIILLIFITPAFFGGLLKLTREKKDSLNPSPSPSPIRYLGWPEYLNDTYRYKLKYPYDWVMLKSESGSPNSIIFINIKEEEYPNKPHITFQILVDKIDSQTLNDYPEIIKLISQGYVARKLTISNSPALFIDNLGDTGELSNTYIKHKDNIFRLSWDETEIGLIRPYEDTLLQIIASFQFID